MTIESANKTCHWHPQRETGLSCSQCGKPMCVECMRQHPVGIRCKECASFTRLPTYKVSAIVMTRGLMAMAGLAIAGGLALFILDRLPGVGFFSVFAMMGVGYVTGEGISTAVNRRRGRRFQCLAAGAVLCAVGISWLGTLLVNGFLPIGFFPLLGALIAVVAAVKRLQP
jgi:hypothetical protein